MHIDVGNLAAGVSESDLRRTFAAYGRVTSAVVIRDRDNRHRVEFGFVEMPDEEEARAALRELNGKNVKGKPLRLREVKSHGGWVSRSIQGGRGSSAGPAMRRAGTGRGSVGQGEQTEARGSASDPEEFR